MKINIINPLNKKEFFIDIPLKETPILMKHYKNRLLAVINQSSQVFLSLGGSLHYRSDYMKDIIFARFRITIPTKTMMNLKEYFK